MKPQPVWKPRSFRSFRSCPETMMAGPFSIDVETLTGPGTPNSERLAASSISIQTRFAFPTSITMARSSSAPASDPIIRSPS